MIGGFSTQECSAWRVTRTRTPGGGTREVWTSLGTALPVKASRVKSGREPSEWGINLQGGYRVTLDAGVGLAREDVVKVTAGRMTGTYMQAIGVFEENDDRIGYEMIDTKERPDA